MNTYEPHQIAGIIPMMSDEEFISLKADILENGLIEPIWLYEGRILDGRNRHQACQELEVEITTREYVGSDPVGFVVSLNLKRRHLSSSQLAVSAVEILPWYEVEAKKRQLRTTENREKNEIFVNQRIDEQENTPKKSTQSLDQAAKVCGTNRQYVSDAKKLKEENPELFEKVKYGKLPLSAAKIISTFEGKDQQDVMAEIEAGGKSAEVIKNKQGTIRRSERIEKMAEISKGNAILNTEQTYPVIYCDPPWKYDYSVSDSRQIEKHYPTMDLSEICALPVNQLATQDAILFLWATSPKLAEAMEVLNAWGFKYKTSFAWVKDKIGMGYYCRGQHELILVATRGNLPVPIPENRFPSVINAKRGKHSEKPEVVYDMIDTMYPEYSKIELFARQKRENCWARWGNQS